MSSLLYIALRIRLKQHCLSPPYQCLHYSSDDELGASPKTLHSYSHIIILLTKYHDPIFPSQLYLHFKILLKYHLVPKADLIPSLTWLSFSSSFLQDKCLSGRAFMHSSITMLIWHHGITLHLKVCLPYWITNFWETKNITSLP